MATKDKYGKSADPIRGNWTWVASVVLNCSVVDRLLTTRSFYTINERVHRTHLTSALTMAKYGGHPIQLTNASIDKNFADKNGMTSQTAQKDL